MSIQAVYSSKMGGIRLIHALRLTVRICISLLHIGLHLDFHPAKCAALSGYPELFIQSFRAIVQRKILDASVIFGVYFNTVSGRRRFVNLDIGLLKSGEGPRFLYRFKLLTILFLKVAILRVVSASSVGRIPFGN